MDIMREMRETIEFLLERARVLKELDEQTHETQVSIDGAPPVCLGCWLAHSWERT
jgi:hypothetical protein